MKYRVSAGPNATGRNKETHKREFAFRVSKDKRFVARVIRRRSTSTLKRKLSCWNVCRIWTFAGSLVLNRWKLQPRHPKQRTRSNVAT